ncbi:50S ribosomal protein L7ae [Mycolicibacterium grossiae]|uniref:50S ribosomal protein L7ae n=1 Tax=Mycolicibacterium grossiae TaxID=1552759 RepID=UPI000A4791C4|nr:50S ribosomal protein L7ae [Mycolicibacterium grossiae]
MPNVDDRLRHTEATKVSKVNIPTELHQRARAAVRIVERVTGRRYTIAQFLREAIVAQLAVIARDYNRGREIYPDSEPLEPGRR